MPRLMLSSPPARASSMGVLISAGLRVTDLSPIHLSVCLHIRGNAPTTRHSLLRVGGCSNEFMWVEIFQFVCGAYFNGTASVQVVVVSTISS